MMKKKLWFILLLLPLFFTISGCQNGDEAKKEDMNIEILSGKYTYTVEGQRLALKLKVTNNSNKKIPLRFEMKDKQGNKIYEDFGIHKGDLNYNALKKGQTKQGYLYFDAEEDTKYTLKYLNGDIQIKTSKIAIDTSDYKDENANLEEVGLAYVNTVCIGKNDPNYSKYVSGDKSKEKRKFKDRMKEEINSRYFDNQADDATLEEMSSAIQRFNYEDGEFDTQLDTWGGKTVVRISATLVDLSSYTDDIEKLQNNDKNAIKEMSGKYGEYLRAKNLKDTVDVMITFKKDGKKWKAITTDDYYDGLVVNFSGFVN